MKAGSFAALPFFALLCVSVAAAQQASPPPPPTLPLAPAALSVPNPLSGLKPGPRDLYQSPDRSDRFQHLSPHPAPPTAFIPGFFMPGPYYHPLAAIPDFPVRPRREPDWINNRGGLAIETVPESAQVYVNGFYVGEAREFGLRGRPLDLSAGAYRIEVRAPGHETLTFNALIAPNDIFRYRGDLPPLSSRAVVAVPARPPIAKIYVIPNCYAGDKPPTRALPPGCDRKKLRTQ